MRAPTLLPLVVLVAAVAPAASQVRGPTEITVPVGKLATLPLTIDADDAQVAVLGGDAFDGFREFTTPNVFSFKLLGYQAGTGYVVVSSAKGGKLQPIFTVKVTVAGVPPTPPPPGPTPTPPPDPVPPLPPDNPPDESFPAVRKAAKALPVRERVALATAHRRALAAIDKAQTPKDVADALNAELAGLDTLPPPDLAVQLGKALESAVDYKAATLSDAERAKVKDVLRKITDSLEGK